MSVVFKPLEDVLNKKITVDYPSKVKVRTPKKKKVKNWKNAFKFVWKHVTIWEWEWKVQTKKFSYTVQQILNELNVLDPVEELLQKEAEKVLKPVLKKVGFKFKLEIPYLDQAEKKISNLRNSIDMTTVRALNKALDELEK